ncbi:MAG: inositol monophosphatase [candidate division Zixibacteria bacterium]|nr:inositol monophosphatase [candidate division Zixibacteria bacterium]
MNQATTNPVWHEYLQTAIPIAKAAGDMLAENIEGPRDIELKGAINLVTEMDTRSEEMIMEGLTKAFPDFTIVAEEGSIHEAKERLAWYIDPLDGTTNYAHRLHVWCVSFGLLDKGVPICGVVYHPMGNELFTAVRGAGAFLGDRRLQMSDTTELTNALLATGFPYDIRDSELDNLDHFARFAKTARAIRRMGAAALDLAWTAAGRFDGFWEMKLSPWDCIAGALMCMESGGMVTDWSGQPFDPLKGQAVAANPTLHPQLIEIIRQGRVPQ